MYHNIYINIKPITQFVSKPNEDNHYYTNLFFKFQPPYKN